MGFSGVLSPRVVDRVVGGVSGEAGEGSLAFSRIAVPGWALSQRSAPAARRYGSSSPRIRCREYTLAQSCANAVALVVGIDPDVIDEEMIMAPARHLNAPIGFPFSSTRKHFQAWFSEASSDSPR